MLELGSEKASFLIEEMKLKLRLKEYEGDV